MVHCGVEVSWENDSRDTGNPRQNSKVCTEILPCARNELKNIQKLDLVLRSTKVFSWEILLLIFH